MTASIPARWGSQYDDVVAFEISIDPGGAGVPRASAHRNDRMAVQRQIGHDGGPYQPGAADNRYSHEESPLSASGRSRVRHAEKNMASPTP